jgi:hypothetical protein
VVNRRCTLRGWIYNGKSASVQDLGPEQVLNDFLSNRRLALPIRWHSSGRKKRPGPRTELAWVRAYASSNPYRVASGSQI